MEKIATPEKYSARLDLQFTLIDLLRTISGLKLFMFKMPDNIPKSAKSTFLTRLRKNNWNVSEQTILSSDHSDRVSHTVRLFFGYHKNDNATTTQQRFQVPDTPRMPNEFGSILYPNFDVAEHAVPYISETYSPSKRKSIECQENQQSSY
eukprot:scaffold5516_cov32-Attheya_sp.AAC.1